MRNTILMTAAAALLLTSANAGLALAQVNPSAVKSASEKKDPAAADAADAKVAEKGAKKASDTAKHKAKAAEHKAKVASSKADSASKDAGNGPAAPIPYADLAKDDANQAKKSASVAKHKAKVAEHKAKVA